MSDTLFDVEATASPATPCPYATPKPPLPRGELFIVIGRWRDNDPTIPARIRTWLPVSSRERAEVHARDCETYGWHSLEIVRIPAREVPHA